MVGGVGVSLNMQPRGWDGIEDRGGRP